MPPASKAGVLVQAPTNVPRGWNDCWATSFCEDGKEGRVSGIAHKGPRGDYSMVAEDVMAALPDRAMLGRKIEVWFLKTNVTVKMPVWDLGPHNGAKIPDKDYVHGDTRCKAEAQYAAYITAVKAGRPCPPEGKDDKDRPVTNPAGLDISWAGWIALGVPKSQAPRFSGWVLWRFCDLELEG